MFEFVFLSIIRTKCIQSMLNSFFNIVEIAQTTEMGMTGGLQSEVRINLTRTCSESEKRGKSNEQSRSRTAGRNAVPSAHALFSAVHGSRASCVVEPSVRSGR